MFYHMEVTQGSDYEANFTVTDPNNQQPLNITTGYTVTGKVAKSPVNTETPVYTFPISASGIVPGNGTLIVRIPGAVSKLWDFEKVFFGIKVVNTGTGGEVMGIRGPLTLTHTVE